MTNLRFQAIGMAGQLGAGKSSVARELSERLSWSYGSFGDYVREVADERGLDDTRQNLQAVGEDLIEELSPTEFVSRVVERSNWNGTDGLVVEGIRHGHIAETLRGFVHPVSYGLVFLDTPREVRQLRLQERGRAESPSMSVAEQHSTEREAPQIRMQADVVVKAAGDLNATVSEVLRLLSGG